MPWPATAVAAASRLGLAWVPALGLAVALVLVLESSPLGPWLNGRLHDASVQAVARPAIYPGVLVVDIDDASLVGLRPQLGSWPYAHDVYAVAIGYLRELGARQVAVDVLLSEVRPGEAQLAQVLARRPDVVLSAAASRAAHEAEPVPQDVLAAVSWPAHDQAAAQPWAAVTLPSAALLAPTAATSRVGTVGVISAPLDSDSMMRGLPLLHQVQGRLLPSMALALQVHTVSSAEIRQDGRHLVQGPRRWPVDTQGRVSLLWPSNARSDAVTSLPFQRVMAAALGASDDDGLRALVQGRSVVIGSSAFLSDEVMTPVGPLAGSRLLALAHAALQDNQVLDRGATWARWWLLLWALGPGLWLAARGRPVLKRDMAAALLTGSMVVAASLITLAWGHTESPLLMPLAALFTGLVSVVVVHGVWVVRANRQLDLDRARAEAANQAKTAFLANVSHEIRTPMNALLGVADLLERTPLDAEQRRYVEVFRRSGHNLFGLINDLLDLAKIEAGRLELDPAPFSLHRLLDEQRELLAPKAMVKGIHLDWQLAADLPDGVYGDGRRLGQVLVNLVGNAIKFTARGQVRVRVEKAMSTGAGLPRLQFTVSDTGMGIADMHQQKVFDPFTQADGSVTRQFRGTGLGLSIVRSLVSQMGGQVSLHSVPGKGSVFSFSLPLPDAALPDAALPDAAPPAASLSAVADTGPAPLATRPVSAAPPWQLLLAEDNEVNVMLVQAMLQGEHLALTLAPSGDVALALLKERVFDLVLMDVQMPGMDGHEVTRALRTFEARSGRRPVPVIALTAHAYEHDVQLSLSAGCNAHLSKPIGRELLLAAIDSFLPPQR